MKKLTRLLRIKEAAAYLNISVRHLYRLAQQGRIPALKAGRSWRFRKDHLWQWLMKHFAAKERQHRGAYQLSRARYQRLVKKAPTGQISKTQKRPEANGLTEQLLREAGRGKQLKRQLWHKPKPPS